MNTHQDSPIRVGLAGLGRSGWGIHGAALDCLKDHYRITAIADADPARRQEAVKRWDCRAHETFGALAADAEVELLVVATPNHLHTEHTIQALKAGKHVVCEKPMALSAADADRMIETARQTEKVLTIFQNKRYAPDFRKVREVIRSRKLGRIVQIRIAIHRFARRWDWQTLKEFGGGELNNTCPHFLDQALLLFGSKEPEVFCEITRTLTSGDAEDHCKIVLRADGAPTMDIEVTHACAYPQNLWHVMGTRGGLTGDGAKLKWRYVDFSKLPPRPVEKKPVPDRTYNREELPWQEESWTMPEHPPKNGVPFYHDVLRTLRHGAPPAVTPESVRRHIVVLQRCRELCCI